MIDYIALIKKYDSPLYVYDGDCIKKQFVALNKAFSSWRNVRINYAMKALSSVAILQLMKQLGSKVDAVSLSEIKLAMLAGFEVKAISFTPNGVPFSEIEAAITLGVHITLDNLEQIQVYATKYSDKPLAIRIKPNVKAGGNEKIAVGHKDSKFGVPLSQLAEIKALVNDNKLKIDGLHLHTGSDIGEEQAFLDAAEVLFQIAKNFNDLQFLDFGSGFKVKYKAADKATNIEHLADKLTTRFSLFCQEYGRDLQLIIEPGKFLVSESGQFLTTVSTVKKTDEKQFVFVDAGFNMLQRPMFYDAYHHIINYSIDETPNTYYDVVGYICEADTFAKDRLLPPTKTGDVLAFQNAGAYAFSMASNYNSRLRPAEVLCVDGVCKLIRKRETVGTLLEGQVYNEL